MGIRTTGDDERDDRDGRDDRTCACGCGRPVSGFRLRAANALARRVRTDAAVFRGALADGLDLDSADRAAALVAESVPLVDGLTALVHGEVDRGGVDKRVVADWLRRAEGPRREVGEAAADSLTGPLGGAVEIFYGGVRAPGEVVAVRDTGTTVNTMVRVEVTVEVRPPGAPSFEVSRKVLVSRVAFPRVGDHVEVGVDPAEPARFAYRPAPAPADATVGGTGAAPSDAERIRLLGELARLHRDGVLGDEEFTAEKARLLAR